MAVCNLFNELRNTTGNFLMFSQYVEDITHNYTEGDNWKVIPTKFVALDIDYSKIDRNIVLNGESFNSGIPNYFQDYFENACAYGRGNDNIDWNPLISRNLFWKSMFLGKFISSKAYTSNVKYIPEVKYFGEIDMHSFNEHKGMGYSEIYCYIPSDAKKMNCQVVDETNTNYIFNSNSMLEGYPNKYIGENYPKTYYFDSNYRMSFDDDSINTLLNGTETSYNVNTIVVLYSIFVKNVTTENGVTVTNWNPLYSNIPMGMYITGNFDNNGNITNSISKYVTTSYNTGTSYGLRICNRFSATSNGSSFNTDIVVDNSSYSNLCQLMTKMNENLSLMLDVTKTTAKLTEQYKELESRLSNQKLNVPYVKTIDGVDYWFVNGKLISTVAQGTNSGCVTLPLDMVQERLNNLMDNVTSNDYLPNPDENDECVEATEDELRIELWS